MNFHVFAILERVVAVQAEITDFYVAAVHENIVGMVCAYIVQPDVLAVPQSFRSPRNLHVFQFDAIHLSEHFGRIYVCVSHFQIFRVPQCGSGSTCEKAILHDEVFAAPEWIFALEYAIDSGNVACFLQR